jgi:mRNA interferase MazF
LILSSAQKQGRTRPVLILSDIKLNQILPVVNVLPITSRKQNRRVYPNEALAPQGSSGLDAESIILCYQIRTLDKQRLAKRLGMLDETKLRSQILSAIVFNSQ